MIQDYVALGGIEIANHARLRAYLESVGSPLNMGEVCGCETFTHEVLDELPYTTPDDPDSPAPWYDPDVPESAEFAGLLVLSVDGMDEWPMRRTVTNAITGGGVIGPARVMPRTITITGILLGASCCAVEYGLHWLGEALQGCTGSACGGDCATLYACCPGDEDPAEFNRRYRRTLRRVALVQGPTVTGRAGTGQCGRGRCTIGADILTVEIVLSAATPWAWTEPTPVLSVVPPISDGDECVTWCLGGECEGACRLAACRDGTDLCADPRCAPPAPPTPQPPDSCFCLPLAVERDCYDLDLSGRPAWSADAPVITVRAGSSDLRNLTIAIYERAEQDEGASCDEVADAGRCAPHSVYHVAYVPAGGALTIDGQIGRSVIECGGVCEASPDVYGQDGAPASYRLLDCARYCLCLESDVSNPPAPDAQVTVSVSGRGY